MSVLQKNVDNRDVDKLPTVMAIANFIVMFPLAYSSMTHGVGFWDFIFVLAGMYFAWKFIKYIGEANTYKEGRLYPKYADRIVTDGIYGKIRYPIGAACIYMNFAYVLLFRAFAIIPIVPFFVFAWFALGKIRDDEMVKQFGEEYKLYMLSTGMFRGKGGAGERLASSGYGMY